MTKAINTLLFAADKLFHCIALDILWYFICERKFNAGGNAAIDLTLLLYDLFSNKTVSPMEIHGQFVFFMLFFLSN